MNTEPKTASTSDARKRAGITVDGGHLLVQLPGVEAENIFLKQAGISDTAEFNAAGIQCAMSGLTAADLTRIAAAHARGELVIPDDPEPGPDLSLIPTSRKKARPVEVNGVVVTCWLSGQYLKVKVPGFESATYVSRDRITSVREVRVLADDQVAVPRELVDLAGQWKRLPGDTVPMHYANIINSLAAVDRDGES